MKINKTIIAILISYFAIFALVFVWLNKDDSKDQTAVMAQNILIQRDETISEDEKMVSMPAHLVIPSVGVILPIEEGNYEETTKTWNVSEENAHFATITSLPNTVEGNTLIYGHNTDIVLGRTKDLKIGDTAIVYLKDGTIFEYEFVSHKDVMPNDTEIFGYSGEPVLTVVTCTGIADQKRRLMTFNLIKTI